MPDVTFTGQALRDIDAIIDRLARDAGPHVSTHFADDIDRLTELLADFSKVGRPTRRATVRMIRLSHFPYLAFYRPISSGELRILRIRHAHRRPLSWT